MDATTRRDLDAARQRHDDALDRFVNAWIEMVNIEYRIDVLLDRANAKAATS